MSGVLRLSNNVTGRSTINASASNDQTYTLPALGGTLVTGGASSELIFPPGTEALPGLHVQGDVDTGLYAPAANTLGISTGGNECLRIDSSGDVSLTGSTDQRIRLNTAGAGGNDSVNIRGDGNALKYNCALGATGVHIFETGGTERLRIDSAGRVNIAGNDVVLYESLDAVNSTSGGDHRMKIRTLANGGGDPYLFFDAGGNNMIVGLNYQGSTSNRLVLGTGNSASDAVGLKVNGVGDAFADKRFLIGTTDVTGLNTDNGLKIKSNTVGTQQKAALALEGTGGDFYAIRYINSDITVLSVSSGSPRVSWAGPSGTILSIYQTGSLQVPATYNNQLTGSTRDMSVDSSGFYGFISSTRESKTNIESLSDISWLYSLNPVSFNYREKEEDNTFSKTRICNETMYGLVAEEVEPIAPELCYHDDDNNLVGVEYRKLIPVLLSAVQEQKELIESLESRIATLENT